MVFEMVMTPHQKTGNDTLGRPLMVFWKNGGGFLEECWLVFGGMVLVFWRNGGPKTLVVFFEEW